MALAEQGPPPEARPPCFNVIVHTDTANGPVTTKAVTECVPYKKWPVPKVQPPPWRVKDPSVT